MTDRIQEIEALLSEAEVTPQLLAFIKKQMARVYLKAPGALIWAFGDMTHLRYF